MKEIMNNLKVSVIDPPDLGGQQCGMQHSLIEVYSDELSLTIRSGYYRSKIKNLELVKRIIELTIKELNAEN